MVSSLQGLEWANYVVGSIICGSSYKFIEVSFYKCYSKYSQCSMVQAGSRFCEVYSLVSSYAQISVLCTNVVYA